MTNKTDPGQEPKTFTQEQLDEIVKNRLQRAREGAEKKAASAAEQAAQDTLVAEQKWKELAEHHEARVVALEGFEAEATAYRELIAGMLKDRIKALGDAAKKAVGGLPEGLSDSEKLNWLNQNEALFTSEGDGPVGSPKKKVKLGSVAGKSAADVGHRRLRI